MNNHVFLILLLSIGLSASIAQAADANFCDGYAKTSVKHQVANVAQSCNEKGSGWSPLYITHKAWCRDVSRGVASKAIKDRNQSLGSCGADIRKFNWDTLPDIPLVWGRLFDQMLAAVKQDDVEAIKLMHNNGVKISYNAGPSKQTILYKAIDLQAEKISRYLLSQNASTKISSHGGNNALSKMIDDKKINYRLLNMLLKGGFDPNKGAKGSGDQAFPLLLAANNNNYAVVKMMIEAGGNPNLTKTATPLLYAVANRNMSMAKLLMASGANPNLSGNGSSCLPLDKALKSGSKSMIDFLKAEGAKSHPSCR